MDTIYLSKCCKEKAVADYLQEEGNTKTIFTCLRCEKDCEVEEVCAYCLGAGEVECMEYVYPGEPHKAPIGMKPCVCKVKEFNGDGNGD